MAIIVIKFMGGVGNQLFQYSLYDFLSRKGYRVLMDLNHYSSNITKFYETISLLNLKYENTTSDLNFRLFLPFSIKSRFMKHVMESFFKAYYIEKLPILDFNLIQILSISRQKFVFLEGYFQGSKIISNELKNHILFGGISTLTDSYNVSLLKIINNNFNSVSVHVRRGDYLDGSELRVLTIDYYIQAIQEVKNRVNSNLEVFVFSDDIIWCKNSLKNKNYIYVDKNFGENSYKDMFLMASCRNNIISASTFSWWAAYLNNNPEKIVVAPKFWYSSKFRYKENFDLRISDWVYL